MKQVDAGVLNVGYVEAGPAHGRPVLLLHGFPYDIHSFAGVTMLLHPFRIDDLDDEHADSFGKIAGTPVAVSGYLRKQGDAVTALEMPALQAAAKLARGRTRGAAGFGDLAAATSSSTRPGDRHRTGDLTAVAAVTATGPGPRGAG